MIRQYLSIFLFCGYLSLPVLAQPEAGLLTVHEDLQLLPLAENLYVHISWIENEQYGRFSSNGVVYIQNGEALIIDSPMKEQLMQDLAAYIREKFSAKPVLAVPGHFHDDCLLGLPYLHSLGARSISGKRTQQICREKGLVVPQRAFKRQKKLKFHGKTVHLAYFGGGHAPDNIVVWFPEEKVLFGGCLIRALEATGLGYTGDAVMDQWSITVGKVQQAFPEVEKVIPGHGKVGDGALLKHTIRLSSKAP